MGANSDTALYLVGALILKPLVFLRRPGNPACCVVSQLANLKLSLYNLRNLLEIFDMLNLIK